MGLISRVSSRTYRRMSDFLNCAEKLKTVGGNLANIHKLYFDARYKQATCGKCITKQPGLLEFEARKKWEAWKSVENLSKDEAESQYITRFEELFGKINIEDEMDFGGIHPNLRNDDSAKNDDSNSFGLTVHSQPAVIPDFNTKLSTKSDSVDLWCCLAQENNSEGMQVLLDSDPNLLNSVDDDGNTALHWAVDRSSTKVLTFLLKNLAKIEVNKQNNNLETALHLCSDVNIWKILVESFKIDTTIEDDLGEVACLIE